MALCVDQLGDCKSILHPRINYTNEVCIIDSTPITSIKSLSENEVLNHTQLLKFTPNDLRDYVKPKHQRFLIKIAMIKVTMIIFVE